MLGNNGRLPQAEADAAATRAVQLYREIGPPCRLHLALWSLASIKGERGAIDEAFALIDELERLEAPDWPVQYRSLRINLQATTLVHARRYPEALAAHQARYELLLSEPGETVALGSARANLCFVSNLLHRYEQTLTWTGQWLGAAGSRGTATEHMLLSHAMHAQSRLGLVADAARLDGVAEAYKYEGPTVDHENNIENRERTAALSAKVALAEEDLARWRHEGAALDDNGIVALCMNALDAAGHP